MDEAREAGDETSRSPRQARLFATARRTRRAATVLIVVSIVVAVCAVAGNWISSFDDNPQFGNPDLPGKYRFAQFSQNLAYLLGFPIVALAAAFLLRMQADRMEADAAELDAAPPTLSPEDVLTVDFSHPTSPVLPLQSSPDDSVWRPPDSEAADNPFRRSG